MPTFKANETEFVLAIHWAGTQYRTTVPKQLIDRIRQTKESVRGEFELKQDQLQLRVLAPNTQKYKKD